MKVIHLFVYGDIVNDQSEFVTEWGCISLNSLRKDYQDQSGEEADEVRVHIHSRGGDVDEGFAIHDWLRTLGKKIKTIGEGLVCSIATVVLLAGEEDSRLMTENSEWLIHNPWGGMVGDADDFAEAAQELRDVENKLADFYATKTGGNKDAILAQMKKDKMQTPQDAKDGKFITEIIMTTAAAKNFKLTGRKIQALALIKSKNQMDIKKELETFKAELQKQFKDFKASLKGNSIKAMTVTTEGGEELTINTGDSNEPAEGNEVTIGGQPAKDGTYKLSDGRTITVGGGKITKIEAAPAAKDDAAPDAAAVAKLKKDLSDAQAKVTNLEGQLATATTNLTKATDDAKALTTTFEKSMTDMETKLNKIISGYVPDEREGTAGKLKDGDKQEKGADLNDVVAKRTAKLKAEKEAREKAKNERK